MARKQEQPHELPPAPEFSDADKSRAGQWFRKGAECRERRDYNYAIECYLTGLNFWPEAVEEGHMPLHSLAVQRQQAGGKKPGLMDGMRGSLSGRDTKKALLAAERLLSMDPQNTSYMDALLKNAIKAGYLATVKWIAPLVFDSLRKDKKPNKARFHALHNALVEATALAEARGDTPLQTWLLEQALHSTEYLIMRLPGDEELRNAQRDLASRLTITRGKYEEAEDFRQSLQDADKQKLLHDSDRVQKDEESLEALIEAARRDWQAAPDTPVKFNAYIDALLRSELKPHEDEAVAVLMAAFEKTQNYSFKSRADDVRLRQLSRQARTLVAKARETHADEDRQQARLAALEQRQLALEVYRERVQKYPTDLRLKSRLGSYLFETAHYDEAIPVLQAAQADPRSRARCELLLGRAFFEKGDAGQATAVLREALEHYELTDEHSKELLYWLGRAHEGAGQADQAREAYGKLLRQDYNFMDGDARKRLEKLG
jgi:tetratricopeptide (TPR) repeat protein